MSRASRALFVLGRVLAGAIGAFLACIFIVVMCFPPPEAAPFALVAGAFAGVLLDFARSGSRRPWRAAPFLPALYLVQVPAIHLALRQFPHHRAAHCLSALAASALLIGAFVGIRRLRDRSTRRALPA